MLVIAAVVAGLLLLDAFGGEAFGNLPVPGIATFLAGMPLFYVALFLIAVDGRRWGVWVALGLSAGALLLSAWSWLLDRRR